MVAAALLLNALVMGGLSVVADRYQARLAWLVPLLAGAALLAPPPGPPSRRRSRPQVPSAIAASGGSTPSGSGLT